MRKEIAFLLILPFSLFGENLGQLIELSKSNKMLNSSKISLEATKDSYESVKNGYMPQLTLGGSYTLNNHELTGVPQNSVILNGSLNYVIYDGGKKYDTYDYYDSTIKSGTKNLENLKNQIQLQVVSYYYNYLAYKAQKEAKLQEIEQLQAQYERLQKFYEVGTVTQDEVDKMVSNIESAKVELHQLDLNLETITHNLEYVVGKAVNIEDGSKVSDYNSKESKLRADIKAMEFQLKALLSNAKSVKSGNLPTLSLNDTYSNNDLNYKSNGSLSNLSTNYNRNLATLNLSWKIFDFGATNKSYESAYKQYLALKSEYEYERNRASVDLKLAQKAYDIGELKIESAKASLKAANSAYETIKIKYENGLVDNIAYLGALTEKYNAQSALKVALYDLEIRKANIIYYSGENLEEFVK